MTAYIQKDQFNTIEATALNEGKVVIYVEHSLESFGRLSLMSRLPVSQIKKSPYQIIDVSGRADGAGSIVKMQWNRVFGKGDKEIGAVVETPEQLYEVFKRAGVSMPKVSMSLGAMGRKAFDVVHNFFETNQFD